MTDKELVRKMLENHKPAINRFYNIYKPKLIKLISRNVDNPKDTEEIMHDTLLSALDSLPLFAFNCSLLTWLCAIARHEIADFYRKRKIKAIVFSRLPFLEKLVSKALSPELAMQEKEMKAKIYQTFKSLSEGYSYILRLKYIEGKTYEEIAVILDKSAKAVESQLSRARLAFQKEYYEQPAASSQMPEFSEKDWELFFTAIG